MTIGMVVSGLATCFEALFARYPSSMPALSGPVAGAALLTLGVGVRVPQRFALWISRLAWRRFLSRGRPSDMSRLLISTAEADQPLSWMVLSIVALLAGVLTAVLPLSLGLAGAFYAWMHAHFLWSVGPLAVLQAAVILVTGVAPLAILGLALSCVPHRRLGGTYQQAGIASQQSDLASPVGQAADWRVCPTHGWILIGAAGGGLIALWIVQASSRANLMVVAAALPVLVTAVLAGAASSAGTPQPSSNDRAEASRLPLWSDRWPRLLRASVVAVGGCGTCAVAVWTAYVVADAGSRDHLLAAALVGLGAGGER